MISDIVEIDDEIANILTFLISLSFCVKSNIFKIIKVILNLTNILICWCEVTINPRIDVSKYSKINVIDGTNWAIKSVNR